MPQQRGPPGLSGPVVAVAAALGCALVLLGTCSAWATTTPSDSRPPTGFARPFSSKTRQVMKGGILEEQAGDDEEEGETDRVVLVLDVDGTLYGQDAGLESQIVRRIKEFGAKHFQLSGQECDDLHHKYGSTIAGLQVTRALPASMVQAYYDEVWQDLDYTTLLAQAAGAEGDKAGYRHASLLGPLLRGHRGPVVLASNSPSRHVLKVVRALGLADVAFQLLVTPDKIPGYPTKADAAYWGVLLSHYRAQDMVLLDDSTTNLRVAREQHGIRGIKVHDVDMPVERAVTAALGAIAPPEEWAMDEARYIREKNIVDAKAFNTLVYRTLEKELREIRSREEGPLCVLDLGAGLLSMLPRIQGAAAAAGWEELQYTAYEMNEGLVTAAVADLKAQGYEGGKADDGSVRLSRDKTTVTIVAADFSPPSSGSEGRVKLAKGPLHLVVGCCLADLYSPSQFVAMLLSTTMTYNTHANSNKGGPLVYLPITFAGETRMLPPHPGDDRVFEAYHAHLTQREGHNLCPELLVKCMEEHGAVTLANGPANWVIEKHEVGYLWECMLFFVGMGVSPALGAARMAKWRQHRTKLAHTIQVGNVDLLFRLNDHPKINSLAATVAAEARAKEGSETAGEASNTYLEFYGPRQVRAVEEAWDPKAPLAEGMLELHAVCSLISSGTELKVYRGDFDSGSAVDVNIKGMAAETLAFPLRYGYSLVGRVVRVGPGVDSERLRVGTLVFAFLAHGSKHIIAQEQCMVVPEGIAAKDAVFLPSMETALSIVHDAAPVAGERVAVVGAGLIGLLATSILSHTLGGVHVTAIDPLSRRREVARAMGADRAVHPQDVGQEGGVGDVDVCLELSGVGAGLQTAIDATGYGGKVVVGSWYGDKAVPLHLGLGFHRSHMRLIVSQVSNISAPLLDRWSKGRRFEYTWELVQRLRPSGLLTTTCIAPQHAAHGYQALDQRPGEELAVMIKY